MEVPQGGHQEGIDVEIGGYVLINLLQSAHEKVLNDFCNLSYDLLSGDARHVSEWIRRPGAVPAVRIGSGYWYRAMHGRPSRA